MPDRDHIAAFRFGTGFPLPDRAAASPESLLAGLTGPDTAAARWPGVTTAEALAVLQAVKAAREGKDAASKAGAKAKRKAVKAGRALALRGARAAYARAVGGHGLRERLVAFWTDHFTVIPRGRTQVSLPSALVEDAIRPHLAAPFAAMLKAVVTHPAMLLYLDQANSIGPQSPRGTKRGKGLNENLARELLELHTLGVGAGYSQTDVREMAELLTGLTVTAEAGFVFDPRRVEPGDDVVLGQSYGGKGLAPILSALEDLARRPETARHLAGKLAVHFVSDAPDPGLVAALETAWRQTDGDLVAVTAALLDHPAAWVPEAAKARQPMEFQVAALKALGLTGNAVHGLPDDLFQRLLLQPLAGMGQPWQTPGGPDGWPEEPEAWITPAGMAARIAWAMEAPAQLVAVLPEPEALLGLALGTAASDRLTWAVGAAESRPEAVGLILSSPEFNRR